MHLKLIYEAIRNVISCGILLVYPSVLTICTDLTGIQL